MNLIWLRMILWFVKKMRNTKNDMRVYLQPAFLICVLVLAAAGAGMSVTMKKLGIVFKKESLPLKKSLESLDEKDLTPYKVVSKQKIYYV